MKNTHSKQLEEKANHKIRTGIFEVITSCFIVLGIMSINANIYLLIFSYIIIVPMAFKGISNFKQGNDLKKQINNPVEPELEEKNITKEEIEEKVNVYHNELKSYENTNNYNYQKVKRR